MDKDIEVVTDFLFARPSCVEGAARLLDFGNTLNVYNASPTAQIADETAIYMDWVMVGRDLRKAMRDHARTIKHESPVAAE